MRPKKLSAPRLLAERSTEPNPMYSDPPGTRYEFSEPFRSKFAELLGAMGKPADPGTKNNRPTKPASIKQIKFLQKLGYDGPVGSSFEASKLIESYLAKRDPVQKSVEDK